MYTDLPTFVRKARKLEMQTEIHTNLSLPLTDEFLEELLSAEVGEIAASIDGFSQESYEAYRRGGRFKLAKTALEISPNHVVHRAHIRRMITK